MNTSTSGSSFVAYWLLAFAALAWGGNAVAGRMAAGDWPPFTLTLARWGLALIFLLPFVRAALVRDREVLKKSRWILLLLGACGMNFFGLLMYLALNHTTAINVSIEQAAMPVLIMLANFLVFSQRVSGVQIVGLALSILGVFVTTTEGRPWLFFSDALNRGDAFMLMACVFYAGYTFGLRWRPKVHWLTFIWYVSLGAFVCALPFAIWELTSSSVAGWSPSQLDGSDWLLLAFITIFPSILSQLAYARGVELIGGNRAGLFINLVPVFGSLLAVLVLGERFRGYHALGIVLVIGGILLAERAVRPARD